MALAHVASGKVREIYAVDDHQLLLVATDRISAYDAILDPEIPDKGRILTGIAAYFFSTIGVPHHLVSLDVSHITDDPWLLGRAMIVKRAEMIPLECVVRGYLYGSAWREYAAGGGPTTEHLPTGLEQGSKLDPPIFTPATKSASGHDQNLTETDARAVVGDDLYERLRDASVEVYTRMADHVRKGGMVMADTKLEFGFVQDTLVVADEIGTPDSSRYWLDEPSLDHPVGNMPSLDKQYVRDWLDSTGWDHLPPAPTLSSHVVAGTRDRYVEAFEKITGTTFQDYMEDPNRWTSQ